MYPYWDGSQFWRRKLNVILKEKTVFYDASSAIFKFIFWFNIVSKAACRNWMHVQSDRWSLCLSLYFLHIRHTIVISAFHWRIHISQVWLNNNFKWVALKICEKVSASKFVSTGNDLLHWKWVLDKSICCVSITWRDLWRVIDFSVIVDFTVTKFTRKCIITLHVQ